MIDFSFIIPIYNRPEELEELLASMTHLEGTEGVDFEVLIVEDGSTRTAAHVVEQFRSHLPIQYLQQENQGPSGARNHGASRASGEWLIFLDSDTILPSHYLRALRTELARRYVDIWGGPDKAKDDFTIIQKAINYSMTSPLTTGGIRGGKESDGVDKFYPRTFNMGVRRDFFDRVGGFRQEMRYGEDLDFSMRVLEQGGRSALFTTVWVYHKRRGNYRDFFYQVRNSGRARVQLNRLHPGTMKLVHFLPTLFILFHLFVLLTIGTGSHILLLIYILLIVSDVFLKEGKMDLAFHAVAATYVQFFGYGTGVMEALWEQWTEKSKSTK